MAHVKFKSLMHGPIFRPAHTFDAAEAQAAVIRLDWDWMRDENIHDFPYQQHKNTKI
jgi:hypothetical protein